MSQPPLRPTRGLAVRATGRPRRRRTSRLASATLATVVAAVLLGAGGGTALADPENPSDEQITGAQAAQDAAAAEVGRIAALVAETESRLQQVQWQAEAAGTAYLIAEEARLAAQTAADQAAAQLQAATDAVVAAQARIADYSRDTYKNSGDLPRGMALLDAEGPSELVQKAALLAYVGDHQVDVLDALESAQVQQATAEAAARSARDQAAGAEAAAAAAKAEADAQLAGQQAALDEVAAQKAQLDQQLQEAQVALLELQGARNAYQTWLAQKAAEEEAARVAEEQARAAAAAAAREEAATADPGGAGYVRPAIGRTSSCYGARWGVTHYGVDIAAPIGTPIYAATSGLVMRAGPATGFGLAVYIRGDDGAVTVYGHVNTYAVRAGERVSAGEQIAEVGNRGQSTGPHLHFEVHPGGAMYGGQIDPVPWLGSRGINISGC
ncbi:peptidoglycan DD-metalloendopeptidase family protein [uncultured Modestobacter sp.]|uniref:peptidoglycan DD-metalloendopeptidase family protein n=1 Tax=uncultured Modestobacter sp. TaxID=380048 RepID=UPI00263107A2|nr:M23 family metallopeptidase [uncultured Modestobacter sp.]